MGRKYYHVPHWGGAQTVVEDGNVLEHLGPFWNDARGVWICFIQVSSDMIRVCDTRACIGVVYRGECVMRSSIIFCGSGPDAHLLQLSLDIGIFYPFRLEWNAFVAQSVSRGRQ